MSNRYHLILFLFALSSILFSCKKKSDEAQPNSDCETININLFSISQDKTLGQQVDSQIVATPAEYPLLDSVAYKTSYDYLKKIRDNILNGGKVTHKKDFVWKTKIIHNDSVLNAFCTPGGYIYVYSGLIKYLDHEDDLAGVLGHEMAHADLRHTTKSMTRDYGVDLLLGIVLGTNKSQIVQIANGLAGLKYSRCHEAQADEYSVIYLSATPYKCNGAASFFRKIEASGASQPPQFLSDHPDPGNRIVSINKKAMDLGCDTIYSSSPDVGYQAFKGSLP